MHPDAMKNIMDEVEKAVKSGESEDDAMNRLIPRMAYMGHKVIHTFLHPNCKARWECVSCQHQWVSEEGYQCPSCSDCRQHPWKWVSEPYGPEDRICMYCGISLEEDMGSEKFADYIKRERAGRKKLDSAE